MIYIFWIYSWHFCQRTFSNLLWRSLEFQICTNCQSLAFIFFFRFAKCNKYIILLWLSIESNISTQCGVASTVYFLDGNSIFSFNRRPKEVLHSCYMTLYFLRRKNSQHIRQKYWSFSWPYYFSLQFMLESRSMYTSLLTKIRT